MAFRREDRADESAALVLRERESPARCQAEDQRQQRDEQMPELEFHRPRSMCQRSMMRPPSITTYSSKCASVRHEWFGMISICCPTLNFPSMAAGAAARITPCSCETDATLSSGWSSTAPKERSEERCVGPRSLESDSAPASTTKCDA